jgi:OHCU decarboxylase
MPLSISELNALNQPGFVAGIGWVFEHSPWVAERAWHRRPFVSLAHLSDQLNEEVATAPLEDSLSLLRAHPDLGTRARISPTSTAEQAGAGLDQLTPAEHARLLQLNTAYRERFGFPFLYAVKGSGKFAILEALGRRLEASPDEEFREALQQACRIARFRLETVVTE